MKLFFTSCLCGGEEYVAFGYTKEQAEKAVMRCLPTSLRPAYTDSLGAHVMKLGRCYKDGKEVRLYTEES